jgi:CDGSH-type Zn-finger protein
MTVTVSRDGPNIVICGVPLTAEEVRYDDDGNCLAYRETRTYPPRQRYALCRGGHSKNRPFCDGRHLG